MTVELILVISNHFGPQYSLE